MVTAVYHAEDTRDGLPNISCAIPNPVELLLDLQRQENRPMRRHSLRDRGCVLGSRERNLIPDIWTLEKRRTT
jgi:hypothetical protein